MKKKNKRIFISFALRDSQHRDYLVDQAKRHNSSFNFFDMSARKAWKEHEWKYKCKAKIESCVGLIVLLSEETKNATGVHWEMKCAKEAKLRLAGMYIHKNSEKIHFPELDGQLKFNWSWANLEVVINTYFPNDKWLKKKKNIEIKNQLKLKF